MNVWTSAGNQSYLPSEWRQIPEQLLTDTGHNSPLESHLPGAKRSAKKFISWTSLIHILTPPIVSAVIPTPKYPNWKTHSCRGRNSALTQHPCISLPFYLLNVYKTWRYSEKKQEHSRGFSAVCDRNELHKETSQCVPDSSSHWDAFSCMYHQYTFNPTMSAHKKSCLFPKTYLVIIYSGKIAMKTPFLIQNYVYHLKV